MSSQNIARRLKAVRSAVVTDVNNALFCSFHYIVVIGNLLFPVRGHPIYTEGVSTSSKIVPDRISILRVEKVDIRRHYQWPPSCVPKIEYVIT